MWLVSCRRHGMLTEESAQDPKCELNISSFLTLPCLLDCLICTKNAMSIVITNDEGMGQVRRIYLYEDVYVGTWREIDVQFLVFSYALVFCSFMSSVPLFRQLEPDGCCACFFFFVCLFVFFLSGPLNQELLVHRNCCVCCVKLFQKSGI